MSAENEAARSEFCAETYVDAIELAMKAIGRGEPDAFFKRASDEMEGVGRFLQDHPMLSADQIQTLARERRAWRYAMDDARKVLQDSHTQPKRSP